MQAKLDEEAWDLLARRELASATATTSAAAAGGAGSEDEEEEAEVEMEAAGFDAAAHKAACSQYAAALKAVPSSRMYELYTAYLGATVDQLHAAGPSALEDCVSVAAQYFAVMNEAHVAKRASPELYLQWVEAAVRVDQNKVRQRHSNAAAVCHAYVRTLRVEACGHKFNAHLQSFVLCD